MRLNKTLLSSLAVSVFLSACNKPSSEVNSILPSSEESSIQSAEAKDVVQISLKNKNDLITLSSKSFDLFGFEGKGKTVRARISKEQQEFLKANKFTFKNQIEANMTSRGLMPGYSTYAEVKAKLQELASKNPNIAKLSDIGDTWEKQSGKSPNNDIWCLTITSNKSKGAKPASLFIGGMHSRELAPPEIMLKLAQTLVNDYGKDPKVTQLVDTRDINIVPMVNVDGRIQVENGNNWQRKNTHGKGIDLNRNFDSHWNYQGLNVPSNWIGGDASPSSETYSGPSAASEPEVQAIQNYYNVKKLSMVLDMHAYGEMFFWPVGYSEKDIPEANFFRTIYNDTFKKIGYDGGTSMSLLYPTTGTTDDYAYVKHKIMGLGMEVGQSFRPSYPEVETMWTKLKPNLLYLIDKSGSSMTAKK